jgi:Secretion system C-terminal sorting domain
MKLFIVLLIFLLTFIAYPQADLTIDLFLHDSYNPPYGGSAVISFGLDSSATDGIDPQLGEQQFPPDICPTWWPYFCAKFLLPPSFGSIDSPKDFRFGELPFTGQKTHMIFFVSAESVVTMVYDLPAGVSIHLIDQIGGVFINVNLIDSGQVLIPNNGITYMGVWMYVDYDNVIPVQLTSFTGIIKDGNKIKLNWTTASETNNRGFSVERSISLSSCGCGNHSEWEPIAFVPGWGTTTQPKSYSFTDENITSGTYNYRLKQIDFDGSFKYSNNIEVKIDLIPEEFVLNQNFPNPFNPTTTIEFSLPENVNDINLSIYNIIGEKVAELINGSMQAGKYKYEWNAKDFVSGIYVCELRTQNFASMKKMLLLK